MANTAKNFLDQTGLIYLLKKIFSKINGKVDKVTGKGLSTNDYTTTEKNKLSGIESGAQANQAAFSYVKVGSTTVSAEAAKDTLTFEAGDNVTITPDATNDKLTIAASFSAPTYSAATSTVLGLVKSGTDITVDASGNVSVKDNSHNHEATNITGGTLSVERGGTGASIHTVNSILTGNGTASIKDVATAKGAFYASSTNGIPQFGTLPIALGGTGATSAANAVKNLGYAANMVIVSSTEPTSAENGMIWLKPLD